MEQCLAWRIFRDDKGDEHHQLPFKNSKDRCFTPYRCQEVAGEGGLCKKCNEWRKKPLLLAAPGYGNYQVCYLGLVTEPIQAINMNRMAFSPWFMDMFKKHGMTPENLNKLRVAWAAAVAGLKDVPPLPDMGDVVVTPVPDKPSWTPPEKKKKAIAKTPAKTKRAVQAPVAQEIREQTDVRIVTKSSQEPAEVPLVVAPPLPQPEVKVKRTYKNKVATAAAPLPPAIAILSEEKPVEVDNVETIEVTIKHVEGKDWYYDSRNHKYKLYDPKTGKYVGRYESENNTINRNIPDSDHEA
jgi:uncharacterized ParB-like nuclease family protein